MFKKPKIRSLDLDDTISQSGNLGRDLFDRQLLTRPLSGTPIYIIIGFCFCIFAVFIWRIVFLITVSGDEYEKTLYRNRLSGTMISAPRGIIIDRNGKALAQSIHNTKTGEYTRDVADIPGIGSLIGFIRYPQKDSSGYYWRFTSVGVSGLEKIFDTTLRETPGYRYTLSNKGKKTSLVSEEKILYAHQGNQLKTTLDKDLTQHLGDSLNDFTQQYGFDGGAGLIMDIKTGELLSSVSLPDIDPDAASRGDAGVMSGYLSDTMHPLLNRTVFGGFSPGSTVKPYMVTAFLNENIITADTRIFSNGKIVVKNPYDADVVYTFRDWKPEGHGWTNARHALAESVNSFFYIFGGGDDSHSGLGIIKMKQYMQQFGLGESVPFILPGTQPGQVPDPKWKKKTFDEAWRLGDSYNSAIGQYGFIVTPLQQLRAVAALASRGNLINPVLIAGSVTPVSRITGIRPDVWETVHQGMRDVVTVGTAQTLNIPDITVAAKSGTAQVDNKTKVNSWVIGFWPYESPRYAFVLLAEHGPKTGTPNVSRAMRPVLDWLVQTKQYMK
jgi:penicillin-binding protein 2